MRSSLFSLKPRGSTPLTALAPHAVPTISPCSKGVQTAVLNVHTTCSIPRRLWPPAGVQPQQMASTWHTQGGRCMSSSVVMHARASPSSNSLGSSSSRKPSGGGRGGAGSSRGRPPQGAPRYSQPRSPRPPSQPANGAGDPWSQGVSPVSSSPGKPTPSKPSQVLEKHPGATSTQAQPQQQELKPNPSTTPSKGTPSLPASTAAGTSQPPADDNQTPEQHQATFQAAVTAHGLSQTQVTQLYTYLDYLLETNKVMNLTAVRDRSEALTRHLVDSLALLPVLDQHLADLQAREAPEQPPSFVRLIDVGTGAGLPGMVLAIARPQWKVTLLDSLRKRCDFLGRAAELAGLSNVQVVWSRAEDGGRRADLRDMHDVAVARAVADARVLAELCLPFVRPGGLWVAAKGPDPEVEVEAAATAITKLGGVKLALHRVESHSGDGQRTALVVSKAKPTPAAYPRSPGTPNKSPL